MSRVVIANKIVGEKQPPFIVAEVGINHNGELSKAFEMISVAKRSGADAVKFQTFRADELVSDPNLMFTYRSQGKEITESMLEMFRRYELSKDDWWKIKRKCDEEGIAFLSTPQNRSDLEILLEIGIPAIKVGSDDFTNTPLLQSYASTGLPLIVSCGMADLADVYYALQAVGTFNGYPTVLLLCTSQYPTPPEDVNLNKISTLKNVFPHLPIGFSDHTQGPLASSAATALGACFFEKHFTLDRDLPGPDHWFSEDPISLNEWVRSIRTVHYMLGDSIIKPTREELNMRILARRSIVAIKEIQPGDLLTEDNIGLRRPGDGLPPSWISKVLGLRANKYIAKDAPIQLGDMQ